MQERKVKKISEMNVDASIAEQNGNIASSSVNCPGGYLPNGGCSERPYNHLNNELSFPPGRLPSLRLPMVVVLNPSLLSYKP